MSSTGTEGAGDVPGADDETLDAIARRRGTPRPVETEVAVIQSRLYDIQRQLLEIGKDLAKTSAAQEAADRRFETFLAESHRIQLSSAERFGSNEKALELGRQALIDFKTVHVGERGDHEQQDNRINAVDGRIRGVENNVFNLTMSLLSVVAGVALALLGVVTHVI